MLRPLARALRRAADRLDRHSAPKATGLSFTFERGQGLIIHRAGGGDGCRLWYYGDDDYENAYRDAKNRV